MRLRPQPSEFAFFILSMKGAFFVMENSKSNNGEMPGASGQNPLEDIRTYTVQGKTFVVEPVFKEDAKETVGTILLRLIQSDNEKHLI